MFILFYRTECYACFEVMCFAYLYVRISAVNTSSEVLQKRRGTAKGLKFGRF